MGIVSSFSSLQFDAAVGGALASASACHPAHTDGTPRLLASGTFGLPVGNGPARLTRGHAVESHRYLQLHARQAKAVLDSESGALDASAAAARAGVSSKFGVEWSIEGDNATAEEVPTSSLSAVAGEFQPVTQPQPAALAQMGPSAQGSASVQGRGGGGGRGKSRGGKKRR